MPVPIVLRYLHVDVFLAEASLGEGEKLSASDHADPFALSGLNVEPACTDMRAYVQPPCASRACKAVAIGDTGSAMDRQLVDQTASELELHRVLWLIKFLRAMVLHVFLALVAILLFFLAGIHDVYPLATDMIQAMRAQAIQNRLDGAAIGSSGFALVASLLFIAMLALLVWAYVSITNVRRNALRFQALLMLAICLWGAGPKWQEVRFAFENLDFLFALLAAFGTLLTVLVLPFSVVYALWRVARSPERSNFIATLDPRLAPGFWTYLNKLLDLPRTPLRTVPTATAYALALAGAFLLIASMMYLITAGSTPNKLAALAIACKHREVMAECLALSSRWARGIPFALLLAVAGVVVSGLLQSTAKRLGALGVSDVLKRPDDPFLLYLRPFDTDDVFVATPWLPLLSRFLSFRPFPVRIEEELFDVADGFRPLIAVGKPGGSRELGGWRIAPISTTPNGKATWRRKFAGRSGSSSY